MVWEITEYLGASVLPTTHCGNLSIVFYITRCFQVPVKQNLFPFSVIDFKLGLSQQNTNIKSIPTAGTFRILDFCSS